MLSEIKITNSGSGTAVIDIEGRIGVPEEWQFENPAGRIATYDMFRRRLDAIGKIRSGEVVVNIRSTGGDVGDALLIYDALAALENAAVTTRCFGYAASAATIIAQAASGGRREISANSLYLIHNAVGNCEGNARDFRQGEELLAKTDERIASIYAAKSGRDAAQFISLMAENNGGGRWLSPVEAIAEGLADRVVEAEPAAPRGQKPPRLPGNFSDADVLRWRQDAELEKLRVRVTTLESENAQLRARPTGAIPKEDPSPTESPLTANENAYRRDAESFFK